MSANFTSSGSTIGAQIGKALGNTNVYVNSPQSPPELPCVQQATFNHKDHDHLRYCYEGTRQELLHEIYAWVESSQERPFLWLCGWPGTGKTTIARTVARTYKEQGASFIFQKGNGDCESDDKFVTTVASQLTKISPEVRKSVEDTLKNDSSILSQGFEFQWEQLVLKPLEQLPNPGGIPYVLVIDALDECKNGKSLFSKLLEKRPTGLRILITSRPQLLKSNLKDARYRRIVLHDLAPGTVNSDILLFFQKDLGERRPGWPEENSLRLLVDRANGIFEWAAIACRFLESDGVYKDRLQRLLGDGASHPPQKELSSLYLTILSEYVSSQEWEMEMQSTYCNLLREYLGSLVVLFDQLPPRSFYKLITRDTNGFAIHEVLSNLGSIIDFPADEDESDTKIRIHHPTFRDFLLDRERCTDNTFYVERKQAHKIVLDGCLDLLSEAVERDMCQPHDPIISNHDAGKSHAQQALLPETKYACLYWVSHLIESGESILANGTIRRLLFDQSLHWLELLGWMSRSIDALIALERLLSLNQSDQDSEIFKFIEDLTMFTRHNRNLMEEDPRQLYTSALIFAPSDSLVRRRYAKAVLRTVQYLPQTRPHWPYGFFRSLEDHDGDIQVLAFSESRNILASASGDLTIQLWNMMTGERLQTIAGFQYPVTAIGFSKDGKVHFLASLSNRVVQIWDVRTGSCVLTLPNEQGYKAITWINDKSLLQVISYDNLVEYWRPESQKPQKLTRTDKWVEHGTSVIFSGDSTTFATWSATDTIRVWRVEGNRYSEKVALDEIETGRSPTFSLSQNGTLLASAEKTIQIHDTNTGREIFSLEGHLMNIRALAFAANSRLLASGSNDRTIKLWSLVTKRCLQKLEGHALPVFSLTFSNTSNMLASGSQDATVRLWDVGTIQEHERQETPRENLERVTTLAVTDDGQKIAVGFSDSCIHLYDILYEDNKDHPAILEAHKGQISDLHFLECGETLASASFDGTIQLWDTTTSQHLKTFARFHTAIQSLVLTDDHEMLASVLQDFTISTWTVRHETLPILAGHTDYIESVVFSQPDQILASASRDRSIRIWNIMDGACLKTLNGHEHWVKGLALKQDKNTLASASFDNTVRLWDISSGDCFRIINHAYGVEAVAISSDQRILASICGQRIISIWDISQGQGRIILTGRSSRKFGLTSTGQYLITDHGSLKLDIDCQDCTPWEPRSPIYIDHDWILSRMKRLLWVPPKYRTSKFIMVRDSTVVFVDTYGEILALRFH